MALVWALAGAAHADPDWPTVCIPAFAREDGTLNPEHCTPVQLGGATNLNWEDVLGNPETGWSAPDAVLEAYFRLNDTESVEGAAEGWYQRGLAPQNATDVRRALSLDDVKFLTAKAADPALREFFRSSHAQWAPPTGSWFPAWPFPAIYAPLRCGTPASDRCLSAFEFATAAEMGSSGNYLTRPGLSPAQLEAMFQRIRGGN